MAAKRPESDSAEVTPTEVDAGAATPVAVVADPTPAAPDSVPASTVVETDAAPVVEAPTVETTAEPVAVAPVAQTPVVAATPPHQVVYVEAPKPFIAKGNRGFGILIALLSTVIFAAVYAVALIIEELVHGGSVDVSFITTLDFYAPVLMFAVGFIIVVLIVNRAGWAAHVLGSIFVGLIVFFGGTGIILLLHINQIPSNRVAENFTRVLFSAVLIVAALLAREVALWMGFAIASRGRKVRARNADARVLYDQEIAAKRAEYEQANARNATGAVEPVVAAPAASDTGAVEPVVAEPVSTETTAP